MRIDHSRESSVRSTGVAISAAETLRPFPCLSAQRLEYGVKRDMVIEISTSMTITRENI